MTRELDTFYETFWTAREQQSKAQEDETARWKAINFYLHEVITRHSTDQPLRILDLGCGMGWLTDRLSNHGETLGIDPVQAAIRHATNRFPRLQFLQATAGELLQHDSSRSFDVIVSTEVIEHVPYPEQRGFLRDAFSIAEPGGFVILTTPRGELWSGWVRVPRDPQPVEDWLTEEELKALCSDVGFSLIAHDRAYLPRRSPTWEGRVLKSVFLRKHIRDLPLGLLRRWLAYRAKFFQILLLRRPEATGS